MPIPFARPKRVTHRQVQAKASAAEGAAALGLQAIVQVGGEWRAFAEMRFGQRLRWLLTGRGPHIQKSEELSAQIQAPDGE